jgi:nitroreductase/NAD-dependent dihydropyrimidine dehydrogenase PreA subunit
MSRIIIDEKLCNKCNTCSIVCTMKIIEKSTDIAFPKVTKENEVNCMQCGHCESFCPQKALLLDFLPEEKIFIESKDGNVDSQTLSLYMKKRRSIRHFSSKKIPRETIIKLIDVARYAASAGNSQPVKWLIIEDSAEVKKIASLTADWMRSIQNTAHPLASYVPRFVSMWDSGNDFICHSAPHLVFAHIPRIIGTNDPTNAVIAMTHFDIAAPSFGIGTCWAGFVKLAIDVYKPLQEAVAIPRGRIAACAMMFGYATYKTASIPRRNPADIIWK